MAKHQIIYTSCMRGIDGVNDGQQVFSYDESFSDSKTEDVKALFTYQVPSLPAGTLMSEEIAKTMPASFIDILKLLLPVNQNTALIVVIIFRKDFQQS